MSIYTEMLEAGLVVGHHESDLYVKNTQKAKEILKSHKNRSWTIFGDRNTGKYLIDVPFRYDPFWDEVERKKVARGL